MRVVAAHSAMSDAHGVRFTPDAAYAVGGTLQVSMSQVTGTTSPALYTHLRRGVGTYAFPVSAAGTYFVDAFVAEPSAAPGQRVWRMRAEGTQVGGSVDVARAVGDHRAWHVMFATAVTDGCLNLRVVGVAGVPLIGAITVTYESASTTSQQAFDDEFTGDAGTPPSSGRWGFAYGGNGWGNKEQQTYTDRPSNADLDGAGDLVITARHEDYTAYDGVQRHYTSARLTTRNTFTFQYGTATARLQAPAGNGLLAAFWAMGSNVDTVGWPACGETDIIENRGSNPSAVYATLHASTRTGKAWLSSGRTQGTGSFAAQFHTYRLVWGPDALESYVDGQPYLAISSSDTSANDDWPFDHPFFLLLSLAVGGNWAGSPDSTTPFPAQMVVDYVRVNSP